MCEQTQQQQQGEELVEQLRFSQKLIMKYGVLEDSSTRKVRFAPTIISRVYPALARDSFTRDERAAYWWNKADKTLLRKKALEAALDVRLNGELYIRTLQDTYEGSRLLSNSLRGDDTDYDSSLLVAPGTYTHKLKEWTTKCPSVRGLERMVCDELSDARIQETNNYRDAVIQMSRVGLSPEELARQSKALTTQSRIHARFFGHADLQAMDPTTDPTGKIIQRRSWTSEDAICSVDISCGPNKQNSSNRGRAGTRMSGLRNRIRGFTASTPAA